MLITSIKEVNTFDDKNVCLICYDNLNENESIFDLNKSIKCEKIEKKNDNLNINYNISVLNCGHKFHYKCIFMTYLDAKKRKCPYCRSDGGYLHLPDGVLPSYNIHKEYFAYKKDNFDIKLIEGRCKHILTKGKNKNNQCSFKAKMGGYCTRHFKMFN